MKKTVLNLSVALGLFYIISCDKKNSSSIDTEQTVSSISSDTKWSGIIGVDGPLHVKEGATLTIEKGTKIVFLSKDSYLLIEQGGKINAQGTESEMIVFTSTKKEYGATGGVIINGKAPINTATGDKDEIAGLPYGGDLGSDNSGVLKYCRIEFGGNQITDEKEHNGFTFNGVGFNTVVENLQAYKCSDDAFEFFGGSVGVKNLVAYGCEDDLFDWTSGYVGRMENLYGEYLPGERGDDRRGIEADNNSKAENEEPRSHPLLQKVTLIDNSGNAGSGLMLRRGTYAKFTNLYVKGFKEAFTIEQSSTQNHFASPSSFYSISVEGFTTLVNSSNRVADIENAIDNETIVTIATGFALPSWAITSDDKTEAGKYIDRESIIKAGGKVIIVE